MSKEELIQELEKYKALYQNEKDHSDTLYRIINKLLDENRNITTHAKEWFEPPFDITCLDRDI